MPRSDRARWSSIVVLGIAALVGCSGGDGAPVVEGRTPEPLEIEEDGGFPTVDLAGVDRCDRISLEALRTVMDVDSATEGHESVCAYGPGTTGEIRIAVSPADQPIELDHREGRSVMERLAASRGATPEDVTVGGSSGLGFVDDRDGVETCAVQVYATGFTVMVMTPGKDLEQAVELTDVVVRSLTPSP